MRFFTMNQNLQIKSGDIVMVDLPRSKDVRDSMIQTGKRPCIVISNDMCNTYSPTITILPLTTSRRKNKLPTHVTINGFGLDEESTVLCECVRPVSKARVEYKIGEIDNMEVMKRIYNGIDVQLGRDTMERRINEKKSKKDRQIVFA